MRGVRAAVSLLFSLHQFHSCTTSFHFQSFSHFLPCVYIYMYVGDSQLLYAHSLPCAAEHVLSGRHVARFNFTKAMHNFRPNTFLDTSCMPRVRLEQYSLLTSYLHSTAPLYSTPLVNYTLLHHHHAVHAVCELSFNAKKKQSIKILLLRSIEI